MSAWGDGLFDNDDARSFLAQLREADPATVGDRISEALRDVAHSEGHELASGPVGVALAALALLLADDDPELLSSAPDPAGSARWFADLDIGLNPGRRLVAMAAVDRILQPDHNSWYGHRARDGQLQTALDQVHRLRDRLTDLQ